MPSPLRILLSDNFDPWFNLATEDWIFHDMDPSSQILFLWRNRETVVIGRHQNPWIECDLARMEKDGVCLARRQSGGGAVFHDLGNTNFTFLSSKESYNKDRNFEIITEALKQFGVEAQSSGRNDIIVETQDGPRKISGNAFKEGKGRVFHHGTLLINTHMEKLALYLRPSAKKLQSKGISSVRSRVANLQEFNPAITHETLCDALIGSFHKCYESQASIERLNQKTLEAIHPLQAYFQHLKNWDWLYGKTPAFTHHLEERFSWGAMDLHLDVNQGVITQAKIFSDSLYPDLIDGLMETLRGQDYTSVGIEKSLGLVLQKYPHYDSPLKELKQWLESQMA